MRGGDSSGATVKFVRTDAEWRRVSIDSVRGETQREEGEFLRGVARVDAVVRLPTSVRVSRLLITMKYVPRTPRATFREQRG